MYRESHDTWCAPDDPHWHPLIFGFSRRQKHPVRSDDKLFKRLLSMNESYISTRTGCRLRSRQHSTGLLLDPGGVIQLGTTGSGMLVPDLWVVLAETPHVVLERSTID